MLAGQDSCGPPDVRRMGLCYRSLRTRASGRTLRLAVGDRPGARVLPKLLLLRGGAQVAGKSAGGLGARLPAANPLCESVRLVRWQAGIRACCKSVECRFELKTWTSGCQGVLHGSYVMS